MRERQITGGEKAEIHLHQMPENLLLAIAIAGA
jgi:hypothetical protein